LPHVEQPDALGELTTSFLDEVTRGG
jgi:hypothetical protein